MTLRKPMLPSSKPQGSGLYALVRNIEVYQVLKSAGLAALIYAPGDFRAGKLAETLRHLDADSIVALPPQMRDASLEEAFRLISAAGHRLMISNVSQLALPHSRPFLVGEGIPVWNARAARVVRELGAAGICLSRELSGCEAQELEDDALEWILPVYGRASVMLLNHCPERVRRGLSAGRAGCTLCDRGEGVKGRSLEDRFHASYPLLPTHFHDGCLITLFHHTALNLMDKAPQDPSWLMDFSAESPQEALQAAGIYHALRSGESMPHGKPACGRFLEGVL